MPTATQTIPFRAQINGDYKVSVYLESGTNPADGVDEVLRVIYEKEWRDAGGHDSSHKPPWEMSWKDQFDMQETGLVFNGTLGCGEVSVMVERFSSNAFDLRTQYYSGWLWETLLPHMIHA